MLSKLELCSIIARQFDSEEDIIKKLVNEMALMSDKKMLEEANKAGLTVFRLRAGTFTFMRIS